MTAMIRRLSLFSVLALFLIISSSAILAEDAASSQGAPKELDSLANACSPDGSLAGKCNTDMLWDAGWYLIRFEQGMTAHTGFPTRLIWVLPPSVQDEVSQALNITTPADTSCYVQVGTTEYEYVSPDVLNNQNEGDFYWSAGRLMNDYSGWTLWDHNVWSVNHYGDCGTLGTGTPAPQDLDILFAYDLVKDA
jgi:hypothetical protein